MVTALRKLQTELLWTFRRQPCLSHHLFGLSELWVSIHGAVLARRALAAVLHKLSVVVAKT